MSHKTDALLEKAKSLNEISIQPQIDALANLGEHATANHTEYDDLQNAVIAVESMRDAESESAGDDEDDDLIAAEVSDDEIKEELSARESDKASTTTDSTEISPAVLLAGVKMIGNKFYHPKDRYRKGFDSAQACGKHFNG